MASFRMVAVKSRSVGLVLRRTSQSIDQNGPFFNISFPGDTSASDVAVQWYAELYMRRYTEGNTSDKRVNRPVGFEY